MRSTASSVDEEPPAPPLPEIPLMWDKGERRRWWRYALAALVGAAAGAAALNWFG